MHIIAGLGNPGEKYENTRHNAGFISINALAKNLGLTWTINKKFKAEIASNSELILIKPQDFMNNSGIAVAAVLNYYKLLPKKLGLLKTANADLSKTLTIIHDDLDIEFSKYKISVNSGSAGHRGVESIINHLKTKNFKRIRIGIRTPELEKIPTDSARSPRLSYGEAGRNVVEAGKFVLQKFSSEEKEKILILTAEIIEIVTKQ